MTERRADLVKHVEQTICEQGNRLIEFRRQLHAHPELSRHEFKTTAAIRERLESLGLEVHVRAQGCGLYTDLVPPGFDPARHPTIAIRGDIDALPILEMNAVPYASTNLGVMHACGHDVHTATVFGTGVGLLAVREQLPGRIRLIFQHAEEATPGGALDMIEFGVLENVDGILALHCEPGLEYGQIGVRNGAFTAALDQFDFVVSGSGGHGARPHLSIDPIFAGTQLASALYQSFGRSFDARVPIVLTIGKILGGTVCNVIPDQFEMSGTIRSISREHREQIEPLLRRIASGVCTIHDARFELWMKHGAPAIINDVEITDVYREVGSELLGPENVYEIPLPSMGGEDFSYYLDHVPGAMFRLGTARNGARYALHSPKFDIDERAITLGARVLAASAIRLLEKHAARRSV